MNPETLRNLKQIAMFSVVEKPADYIVRNIFRWFSKQFSTPLHIVETLPFEDVLVHYFESTYEELEEDERQVQIERLLMDPEKLAALQRAEDASDAEAWEYGRDAAAAAPPIKTVELPVDPITERIERLRAEFKPPEKINGPETTLPPSTAPEPTLPKIEEGIHMKFLDLDGPEIDDAPTFGPKTR